MNYATVYARNSVLARSSALVLSPLELLRTAHSLHVLRDSDAFYRASMIEPTGVVPSSINAYWNRLLHRHSMRGCERLPGESGGPSGALGEMGGGLVAYTPPRAQRQS